jgi:hypothetical protein
MVQLAGHRQVRFRPLLIDVHEDQERPSQDSLTAAPAPLAHDRLVPLPVGRRGVRSAITTEAWATLRMSLPADDKQNGCHALEPSSGPSI